MNNKDIKTVQLTEEMIFAISVALDELSNSGDWADYLSKSELEKVFKGIDELKKII